MQVPCLLYGQNVDKLRGSGFIGPCLLMYCCPCFACIFGGSYRGDLRKKYNLPDDPCSDCCVYCCLPSCAVCQEFRELKHREGRKV